jgi:uncharacterized protein YdhG (YjbR/CyaY superfamily)
LFRAGAEEEVMPTGRATPRNIDEYIASFSPDVQAILEKIRSTIRQAAPDAQRTISYKIPAFTLDGILVYFAAFKKHIGFYPPVRGDAKLAREGDLNLRRREGQFAISAPSADNLRAN